MNESVEATLEQMLIENGLAPEQATEVMDLVKAGLDGMSVRWGDPISNYEALLPMLRVEAKKKAVQWIDQNVPSHWARAMFTGELAGG